MKKHIHGDNFTVISESDARKSIDLIVKKTRDLGLKYKCERIKSGSRTERTERRFVVEKTIPYPYLIPKFHKKKELCWRPIVGTSVASTKIQQEDDGHIPPKFPPENYASAVNMYLSDALRSVLDVLLWEDRNKEFSQCIVINSDRLVVEKMKAINEARRKSQSYRKFTLKQSDMGAMYTSLSQADVERNVSEISGKAWGMIATKLECSINDLRCSISWDSTGKMRSTTWWDDKHPSGTGENGFTFTFDMLKDLISTSIKHNIVTVDGVFMKQKAGLGMGSPSSPMLATLACANVEFAKRERELLLSSTDPFLTTLSVKQRTEVLNFVFRYVDDCLAAEPVPLPDAEEYHVPISLKSDLEETLFLGLNISSTDDGLKWGCVKKSVTFNHKVPRFPHYTSNHPVGVMAASAAANLLHLHMRSSERATFLESASSLFEELQCDRGYPFVLLHRATQQFLLSISGVEKKLISAELFRLLRTKFHNDGGTLRAGDSGFHRDRSYCSFCHKRGHLSHDCFQKRHRPYCVNCGRTGHESRDCRRDSRQDRNYCTLCHRWGHISRNCFRNQRSISHFTPLDRHRSFCSVCQRPGHQTRDCYYYNDRHRQFCSNCNRSGHDTINCWSNHERAFCTNCRRYGHYLRDCRFCQICKKYGHQSRDCYYNTRNHSRNTHEPREYRSEGRARQTTPYERDRPFCTNCERYGHYSRTCRFDTNYLPHSLSGPYCLLCRDFGHDSRDCRRLDTTFQETQREKVTQQPLQTNVKRSQTQIRAKPQQGHTVKRSEDGAEPPQQGHTVKRSQNGAKAKTVCPTPFSVPNIGNTCFFAAVFQMARIIAPEAEVLKAPPHASKIRDVLKRAQFFPRPARRNAHAQYDQEDFFDAWNRLSPQLLSQNSSQLQLLTKCYCPNGHVSSLEIPANYIIRSQTSRKFDFEATALDAIVQKGHACTVCHSELHPFEISAANPKSSGEKVKQFILVKIDRRDRENHTINRFAFTPSRCRLPPFSLVPRAAVLHRGKDGAGHYVSFVFDANGEKVGSHNQPSGWLCDDSKISRSKFSFPKETYAVLYEVEKTEKREDKSRNLPQILPGAAPDPEGNLLVVPQGDPPVGTFWVQDGADLMEMKSEGKTIFSTGNRQVLSDSVQIFYRRVFLGLRTLWSKVVRRALQISNGTPIREKRQESSEKPNENPETKLSPNIQCPPQNHDETAENHEPSVPINSLKKFDRVRVTVIDENSGETMICSGKISARLTKNSKSMWIAPDSYAGLPWEEGLLKVPSPGFKLVHITLLERHQKSTRRTTPITVSSSATPSPPAVPASSSPLAKSDASVPSSLTLLLSEDVEVPLLPSEVSSPPKVDLLRRGNPTSTGICIPLDQSLDSEATSPS
jgi:cellular nucleic acid-binding protein